MAENIGDFFQRSSVLHHQGRCGMTEAVAPATRSVHTELIQEDFDKGGRRAVSDRATRRHGRKKDFTVFRDRPFTADIIREQGSRIYWQW